VYLFGPLDDLIFSHTGKCAELYPLFTFGIGCGVTTQLVTGVALLGWSSFEFYTVQGNG